MSYVLEKNVRIDQNNCLNIHKILQMQARHTQKCTWVCQKSWQSMVLAHSTQSTRLAKHAKVSALGVLWAIRFSEETHREDVKTFRIDETKIYRLIA